MSWYEDDQKKALDNNEIPFPVSRRGVMKDSYYNAEEKELDKLKDVEFGDIVTIKFKTKEVEYVFYGKNPKTENEYCLVRNHPSLLYFFNENKKFFFSEELTGGIKAIERVIIENGEIKYRDDRHLLYHTNLRVKKEYEKDIIFLIDTYEVYHAYDALFPVNRFLLRNYLSKQVTITKIMKNDK